MQYKITASNRHGMCVHGLLLHLCFLSFHRSPDEQNHLVIASVKLPDDNGQVDANHKGEVNR